MTSNCSICQEPIEEKDQVFAFPDCKHELHLSCYEELKSNVQKTWGKINPLDSRAEMHLYSMKKGKPWCKEGETGFWLLGDDYSLKCTICRKEYTLFSPNLVKSSKKIEILLGKVLFINDENNTILYHHITSSSDMAHYFPLRDWLRVKFNQVDKLSESAVTVMNLFDVYMFQQGENFHLIRCDCTDKNCTGVYLYPESLCHCNSNTMTSRSHATIKDFLIAMAKKTED